MAVPTIDLSPFFSGGDEDEKKKSAEIIREACSEHGFFQIVNHGVPLGLMSQAMELSKTFFGFPVEEKLKFSPLPGAPYPAGYNNPSGKKEDLYMCTPGSSFNVFPTNPPHFQKTMEELWTNFVKTSRLVESIMNDCLGLPPNFLKEYNHDRSLDLMLAFHYLPATKTDNVGVVEHQDGNCITFLLQDGVGGLEVRKTNGEWIPVTPTQGALVVNVADVFQVITNNKFKSGVHRVVSSEGRSRYSFAFFYNVHEDKWVEPLSQFTEQIGELPNYRRFLYKEYHALRVAQKANPPSKPEDRISIGHFAIPANRKRNSPFHQG